MWCFRKEHETEALPAPPACGRGEWGPSARPDKPSRRREGVWGRGGARFLFPDADWLRPVRVWDLGKEHETHALPDPSRLREGRGLGAKRTARQSPSRRREGLGRAGARFSFSTLIASSTAGRPLDFALSALIDGAMTIDPSAYPIDHALRGRAMPRRCSAVRAD
ncbi:hypothetical protein GCM10020258_01870 [Sphingomonas yabuuchiae]